MFKKPSRLIFVTLIISVVFSIVVFAQDTANEDTINTSGRITANVVSLNPNDPNSYKSFTPELPEVLARAPQLDPETGIYVEEVEPGLFYITGGVYLSAFLVTDEGVIVFDAPPSYAHQLPAVIAEYAPDQPIKYLVYSHVHTDHAGGSGIFADVPDLEVIGHVSAIESLEELGNPNILMPTITYEEEYVLTLGDDIIEITAADFHAEDADSIIYLPDYKFLIAVDTVTPGEVPFMNFGASIDMGEYLKVFDELLAYDFQYLMSGHLSFLSTREDVIDSRDYTYDVQAEVLSQMPSFNQRFGETLSAIEFENANLAYRMVIESIRGECASAVIEKWQDQLSVVDVWADSHCQSMILYYIIH